MRNSYNFYVLMYKAIAVTACIMLLMFFYKAKATKSNNLFAKTTIYFSKAPEEKINVKIITAQPRKVQLYLFSAGGDLVKKLETDTKQVQTLNGIKKGQYLYQCFEKDIQLKSGKLIVNQNSISYD